MSRNRFVQVACVRCASKALGRVSSSPSFAGCGRERVRTVESGSTGWMGAKIKKSKKEICVSRFAVAGVAGGRSLATGAVFLGPVSLSRALR